MNKIVLFSALIILGTSSCKFFQGDKPADTAADSVAIKAAAQAKTDSLAKVAKAAKPVKHAAPAHKAHGKKHH